MKLVDGLVRCHIYYQEKSNVTSERTKFLRVSAYNNQKGLCQYGSIRISRITSPSPTSSFFDGRPIFLKFTPGAPLDSPSMSLVSTSSSPRRQGGQLNGHFEVFVNGLGWQPFRCEPNEAGLIALIDLAFKIADIIGLPSIARDVVGDIQLPDNFEQLTRFRLDTLPQDLNGPPCLAQMVKVLEGGKVSLHLLMEEFKVVPPALRTSGKNNLEIILPTMFRVPIGTRLLMLVTGFNANDHYGKRIFISDSRGTTVSTEIMEINPKSLDTAAESRNFQKFSNYWHNIVNSNIAGFDHRFATMTIGELLTEIGIELPEEAYPYRGIRLIRRSSTFRCQIECRLMMDERKIDLSTLTQEEKKAVIVRAYLDEQDLVTLAVGEGQYALFDIRYVGRQHPVVFIRTMGRLFIEKFLENNQEQLNVFANRFARCPLYEFQHPFAH